MSLFFFSARKRLIQKLNDEGVPPNQIIQISGHKNVNSLNNYSKINNEQSRRISNILANKPSTSNSLVTPPTRFTGKLVPQKSCQQASLLTAISMEMSYLILTAGLKHRLFPNLPNKCFLLRHLPMTMNHVQLPTFDRRSCLQIETLRG